MASKRKASAMAAASAVDEEPVDPADELMFLCLGGGNEVGRSCHIIQYKGKTVMLDAGQHPAYDGLAALPFFDDFDLSTVDVLLISHFHIDHAASLPYVLAKTNFRGRVFMTHPTKAIYKWLIQDSVRVGNTSSNLTSQPVYTEQDHLNTFSQIEAIDYHTTHTISSIRITPYPAGHVLGAAMFLIEIAGLNIFFTGDYSREQDRHLVSAEVPRGVKIDVLITESTYGVSTHVPRLEREQALMKSITGILNRGGRVLMPVFALGRAQELLLILDEYWGKHQEFQKIPIYYASNLARKCMVVYQTYIGAMNDNIKRLFRERMAEAEVAGDGAGKGGPWDFKYIRSLKSLDRFDDVGSCVMLASPGMLQNGISRELLERWAPNEKNGVIITGYSVEGTMAKYIVQEPDQIQAVMSRSVNAARRAPGGDSEKVMIPRRCSVAEYSFAAHVDGQENKDFIEEVGAPVVILVHGEQHNMMRLKSKLLSLNAGKTDKVKVFSPRNCEELRIPFKTDKVAKVVGKLASIPLPKHLPLPDDQNTELVAGVIVQNDFKMSLMDPEDLREYAGLTTSTIACRQRFTLSAAGIDLIKWALEGTFGSIEELPETKNRKEISEKEETNGDDKKTEADEEIAQLVAAYLVMGCVTVRYRNNGEVELEWEGNMLNDGIADAVMAVLLSVESSPAAVKRSANKHSHSHELPARNPHANLTPEERLERLFMFLEAQFGADALTPITVPKLPPLVKDKKPKNADGNDEDAASDASMELSDDGDEEERLLELRQKAELERLHKIGIPVPGVIIKVDKMVATVWLEDLEVECQHKAFADRVKAVVERAVEITAPLWG
ncbi:beta-lactamase-like protein [Daldinia loculata]|uniref:beta-lactamase-like protein n=1 Tax=Daldinia loculata TaxID=103429 RepID=UPI0020C3D090|nr:beta-lactamase-like protein [Daldinia loculata]KAI1651230.1 beta-lactamase-like protein [Daldinia loculata]